MDRPQIFWDCFRQTVRRNLPSWETRKANCGRRVNDEWTALITESAEVGCEEYAQKLGREVVIGRERHGRLDVYAEDQGTGALFVAFETELAWWGYNGSSGKDWREEFPKLCNTPAEIRVLSSYFKTGTGGTFPAFLRVKLDSMKASFDAGYKEGDFCLIFGPESSMNDRNQPWLAFSLERDFTLRKLTSPKLLIPWRVYKGEESSVE